MQPAVQTEVSRITSAILAESPFSDIEAKAVTVFDGIGPEDEPYVHIVVSAGDPDPKRGTWSPEGIFQLRSRVHELAARSELDLPRIVVDVHPEHADDEEGSDEEQTEGLLERLDDPAS